jgi:hypothetical protein
LAGSPTAIKETDKAKVNRKIGFFFRVKAVGSGFSVEG